MPGYLLPFFLSSLLLFANTFPTSLASISIFAGCVSPFHFDLHSSLPSEMGTCFIRLKLPEHFSLSSVYINFKTFFLLFLILSETGKIPKRSCIFPQTAAFQVPWHIRPVKRCR